MDKPASRRSAVQDSEGRRRRGDPLQDGVDERRSLLRGTGSELAFQHVGHMTREKPWRFGGVNGRALCDAAIKLHEPFVKRLREQLLVEPILHRIPSIRTRDGSESIRCLPQGVEYCKTCGVDVEVSVPDSSELLSTMRNLISMADEAVLCVAFANQAGVRLLEGQFKKLGSGGRLLATTVFGSTTTAALHDAVRFGTQVRVYNHASGTYHPKLYLARQGVRTRALVGSANLTSGLVCNVEVAVLLEGPTSAPPLAALWGRAEALWAHKVARSWEPTREPAVGDVIADELWSWLRATLHEGMTASTVSEGNPNRITQMSRHGLWVETNRSQERGAGAQHVPAWMFNIAWDYLVAQGRLDNRTLLNDLNVHRSSLVCAVLALLPPVTVESSRPVVLAYDAGAAGTKAAEDAGPYEPESPR